MHSIPLDRRIDALAQLLWSLFADPCPEGGHRGVLGVGSADLSLVTWAVLLSEAEARPMAPSKLADFAGLPRATFYRKLDNLCQRGILVRSDGTVRATPSYLTGSELMASVDRAADMVATCAARLEGRPVVGCGSSVARLSPGGPLLPRCCLLGMAVLTIARLAHGADGPWFAAGTRAWMIRWAALQAQMSQRPRDPATLAARTGLSRAAVYRQLAEFERTGEVCRPDHHGIVYTLGGEKGGDLVRTSARMEALVLRTFHRLSDLDEPRLGA